MSRGICTLIKGVVCVVFGSAAILSTGYAIFPKTPDTIELCHRKAARPSLKSSKARLGDTNGSLYGCSHRQPSEKELRIYRAKHFSSTFGSGCKAGHGALDFRGRVTDRRGNPISCALVFGYLKNSQEYGISRNETLFKTFSDDNGYYSLNCMMKGGDYGIIIDAMGYSHRILDFSATGNDSSPLCVTLENGCNVRGAVTDVTGAPVKNASVELTLHKNTKRTFKTDKKYGWLKARALMHIKKEFGRETVKARTDGCGEWSFIGIGPGVYTLKIEKEGYRSYESEAGLTIGVGEAFVERKDRLNALLEVSGLVVDAEGAPVKGVRVNAEQNVEGVCISQDTSTDEKGRFVMKGWNPGEVTLDLAGEKVFSFETYQVEAGTKDFFAAVEIMGCISGKVEGLDVNETFRLKAIPVDKPELLESGPSGDDPVEAELYRKLSRRYGKIVTDVCVSSKDGSFELELPPGRYQLLVYGGLSFLSEWSDVLEVTSGKTTDASRIEVSRGGMLSVKVVDADNGWVIEGAEVYLRDENCYQRNAATDAFGVARLRAVPPGTWGLVVRHKEYINQYFFDVSINGDDNLEETVTLVRGGEISGKVTDQDGLDAHNVRLDLCKENHEGTYRHWRSEYTTGSGGYRFGGLEAGRYMVVLRIGGSQVGLDNETFTVGELGGEFTRDFAYPGSGLVTGAIWHKGKKVGGTVVGDYIHTDKDGNITRHGIASTCFSGEEFSLKLVEGSYRLRFIHMGTVMYRKLRVLRGCEYCEEVCCPENKFEGRVIDGLGKPVNCSVRFTVNEYEEEMDMMIRNCGTGEDGKFELDNVPSGKVRISIYGGPSYWHGELEIADGQDVLGYTIVLD